jgi:hypothetical protein
VNVGFARGNLTSFQFNLNSLKSNGLKVATFVSRTLGGHYLAFREKTDVFNKTNVEIRFATPVAKPTAYGKKFSQIGTNQFGRFVSLATRTRNGFESGADFSKEYYAFYFLDASNQKHYGWVYGTLTGGYSDLSYNLISYAYDTTPNEQITTGQTSIPEPSSLVLGAMASLVLGAAGVRKWKKDQQAKATMV